MARKQYTAIYEHGDRPNQWLASIKELPECHTFGRGIAQTRARIREALVLWEGNGAESADLVEVLPLPHAAKRVKQKLEELTEKIEQALRERADVVAFLRGKGEWSVRDIAEVFDMSYQRIGQMAPAKRKKQRKSMTSAK